MLELVDITRTFPGVVALNGVAFDLRAGEVHALVGENGAGKSTLINVVSGLLAPDSGELRLAGERVAWKNPLAARVRGIVTVHQEAELFGPLSVAENMALGLGLPIRGRGILMRQLVDWRRVYDSARDAVAQMGETLNVRLPAARLSVAQRHMTQVAAAVTQQARVVILDEPTSALSEVEVHWLFEQIARLKSAGAGIIYVSHRQEEIFQLANRITVLRDGRRIWTRNRSDVDRGGLIEAMVGGRPGGHSRGGNLPRSDDGARWVDRRSGSEIDRKAEPPRLRVRGLSHSLGSFRNVDLEAFAGEVVGIYGLIGAGRTEFAHTVFGLDPQPSGTIELDGQPITIRHPQTAVGAGIALVPEDRLRQGLCGGLSLQANTVLSSLRRLGIGLLASTGRECRATQEIMAQLGVKHRSLRQPIRELSGGNQQKVVLGRWLLTRPRVLILDEPTRGVDVGAKAEIHRLLRGLADEGLAILMISSDLPEVLEHSDRILVFREGMVVGEFDSRSATAAEIAAVALPAAVRTGQASDSQRMSTDCGAESNAAHLNASAGSARRIPVHLPLSELGLAAVVVVLSLLLMLTSDGFSFATLLTAASLWTILGLAAACGIIAGGIDISLGSLVAVSAACAAWALKLPYPPAVTIPLGIAIGALVGAAGGLVNGALTLVGRVHPLVVTLGTMTIYRGLVILMLAGQPIVDLPEQFSRLAVDPVTGFRGIVVMAGLIAVAVWVWLSHTRSGRHVYAQGAGPEAARLAGISRVRVLLTAFGVGGLLAGIAGLVHLALSARMQPRLGMDWELQAIAIAVIGGVAITGGRGTVWGVILGAILLRLVNSALVRWGVSDDQVDLLVGGMLLIAVLLDLAWRRRFA